MLQQRYKRVRAKMYNDHKKAVIAEDNAKLHRFQRGCPKPKAGATTAELDKQAHLRTYERPVHQVEVGALPVVLAAECCELGAVQDRLSMSVKRKVLPT